MYAVQPLSKKVKGEDRLDCPFTALGLIHGLGDGRSHRFQVGAKATLPPDIIGYACLCYAAQRETAQTIALAALVYNPDSPGIVFKLTEGAVSEAIASLSNIDPMLSLDDAAGKLSFSFGDDPQGRAERILERYYSAR
jgi:hypothetical protein